MNKKVCRHKGSFKKKRGNLKLVLLALLTHLGAMLLNIYVLSPLDDLWGAFNIIVFLSPYACLAFLTKCEISRKAPHLDIMIIIVCLIGIIASPIVALSSYPVFFAGIHLIQWTAVIGLSALALIHFIWEFVNGKAN